MLILYPSFKCFFNFLYLCSNVSVERVNRHWYTWQSSAVAQMFIPYKYSIDFIHLWLLWRYFDSYMLGLKPVWSRLININSVWMRWESYRMSNINYWLIKAGEGIVCMQAQNQNMLWNAFEYFWMWHWEYEVGLRILQPRLSCVVNLWMEWW